MDDGSEICWEPQNGSDVRALQEGCAWSERSGGVGMVRESKKICPVESNLSDEVGMIRGTWRGIFEVASFKRSAGRSSVGHRR